MALGGGPPGLAILTGIAKGVREEREKERERRRQAVLDSLRKTQVEQAQQSIDLSAAREQRLREMFEADQAQREAEMDAAEAARTRRQEYIGGRVPELVESGMTEFEAITQAGREFDKGVAPTITSDREAEIAERERDAEIDELRQTDLQQRIADRAEGDRAEAALERLRNTKIGLRLTEDVRNGRVSLLEAMEEVDRANFPEVFGMPKEEIREALEAVRGGRSTTQSPDVSDVQALNVAEQLVRQAKGDPALALTEFRREFDSQPVGSVSEEEAAMADKVLPLLQRAAEQGNFAVFGTEIGGG